MSHSTIEWYNENELRAYPIAETATRLDDNGQQLQDQLIVDMSIVVPSTYTSVRISSVNLTQQIAAIGISSGTTGLLIGTFARNTLKPYQAFQLTAVANNVSGWIVFGNAVTEVIGGTYHRFATVGQSRVEQRALHYINPPGVRRFLKYGGRPDTWLEGDVRLTCNSALKIVKNGAALVPTVDVQLDPAVAQNFAGPCVQVASKDNCGCPPIRKINGVGPDVNGKITIEFI